MTGDMMVLSIVSFGTLFSYLLITAFKHGVPSMVSDTFYQLGKRGWWFTVVMIASSLLMFPCMAEVDEGLTLFAFLGCGSLCYVGCAPRYICEEERTIHKAGAICAALFCLAWCLLVSPFPTSICVLITMVLSALLRSKRLYYCEIMCFVDVYLTYWYSC